MDEVVLALLGTLVEIRAELGDDVYRSALERARLALAAEVMVEAERRALNVREPRRKSGNVVFLGARISTGGDDERR
jgi:hypothetical protein